MESRRVAKEAERFAGVRDPVLTTRTARARTPVVRNAGGMSSKLAQCDPAFTLRWPIRNVVAHPGVQVQATLLRQLQCERRRVELRHAGKAKA